MEDRLLLTEEVAYKLSVDPVSVRRWIRDGRLKAVRFGRQWRIHPEELQRVLTEGIPQYPGEEEAK